MTATALEPEVIERLRALPEDQKEQLRAHLTKVLAEFDVSHAAQVERARELDERLDALGKVIEGWKRAEVERQIQEVEKEAQAKIDAIRKGIRP
jgi:hypothetical protein